MRKYLILVSLVLSLFSLAPALHAQAQVRQDVPPIVTSGMDAYKTSGPDDAVKAWLKNGPLDDSKTALAQADNLRQVTGFYGAYQSFDVISNREITTHVRFLYLVMNYEKGPLFCRFSLFRSEHGWIITAFDFNTDDAKIIPSLLE